MLAQPALPPHPSAQEHDGVADNSPAALVESTAGGGGGGGAWDEKLLPSGSGAGCTYV